MAFFKGSYYENVPLFEPDDRGKTIFDGLRGRPIGKPEAVIEHSIALKERLDSLSYHYYAEPREWRWIIETNSDILFPEDLMFDPAPDESNGEERIGQTILIPRRRQAR